jgi:hypothetical protein
MATHHVLTFVSIHSQFFHPFFILKIGRMNQAYIHNHGRDLHLQALLPLVDLVV